MLRSTFDLFDKFTKIVKILSCNKLINIVLMLAGKQYMAI